MQTLGLLEQTLSWTFYLLISTLITLAVVRGKLIFFDGSARIGYSDLREKKWLKPLKVIYAISWILFLFCLPIPLFITSTFRRILPEYITYLIWVSFMLLGLIELMGAFTISRSHRNGILKQALLVFATLILGYNAFKQLNVGSQIFAYPTKEDSYLLALPFDGTWSAGHAGGSELTNYHNAYAAQQYAIDMVKQNQSGRFFKENGTQLTDHAAFGSSLKAPVAGKIVRVVDTLPNMPISFTPNNPEKPAGNHVVIELAPERYLFLAHLDSGSIKVEEGRQVEVGDFIGRVGNSGNTSWPHLHLHIQDLPYIDNTNATGYPFRFDAIERKRWFSWTSVQNGFLLRNDVFKSISD